ncbi:hypothetical protein M404DRAFT_133156, partial [Pisolithus tinctorius Marx 270]
YGVVGRDEYGLLGKPVNYNEGGCWELLNEIHRYGIPRLLQHQKLLKEAIRPMAGNLSLSTGHARPDIVFDKGPEARPGIFTPYEL